MNNTPAAHNRVSVKILGKEFQILCPAGSETSLFSAAMFLDDLMQEIRHQGKVIGFENIAIMAALNVTHDLLNNTQNQKKVCQDLQNKIEQVLIS